MIIKLSIHSITLTCTSVVRHQGQLNSLTFVSKVVNFDRIDLAQCSLILHDSTKLEMATI